MAWQASTPDGVVDWDGGLDGDDLVVERVRFVLDEPGLINVTPTGPAVERDVADELAVIAALATLYASRMEVTGDPPDLTFGAPPDAVF